MDYVSHLLSELWISIWLQNLLLLMYKKEAAKKSPQEGTQAYVVCPIFAANYKRSWLKKKSGFSKTKWTLWLQANTTQIQPVTLGSINARNTKKALCPYLTLTQRTKITAEHRNMDTNKATPDLKPSAQPPSPEDLMEARRVDEEGSKVPARDRPVEETTGADMRNNR